MRGWGVEDLDFGLTAVLLGHRILHDSQAVVGHRFRSRFDNFSVTSDRVLANQIRLARKHFTDAVWSQWLDRCRQRNSRPLADHSEGLWAAAWDLFQADRESVEAERSYLLAHRRHDEFWYASRYGLTWPTLSDASNTPSSMAMMAFGDEPQASDEPPSPSPPPCDCVVTGVDPLFAFVEVGKQTTLSARGTRLDAVKWTGSNGVPPSGEGPKFTTSWPQIGHYQVEAECCGTKSSAFVAAIRISITNEDGSEITGKQTVVIGQRITLKGKIEPGVPVTKEQWTIGGEAIKDYTVSAETGKKHPLEAGDLNGNRVTFHWIKAETGVEVRYTATIAGKDHTATVIYQVRRPESHLSSRTTGEMPPVGVGPNRVGEPARMTFGTFADRGISWRFKVTTGEDELGAAGLIQVLKTSRERTTDDGTEQQMTTQDDHVLDLHPSSGEFYGGTLSTDTDSDDLSPLYNNYFDIPGMSVFVDAEKVRQNQRLSANDAFQTYLMYRPPGGIWVTLRRLDWRWNAVAARNDDGEWVMGSQSSSSNPSSVESHELPEWNSSTSSLSWKDKN